MKFLQYLALINILAPHGFGKDKSNKNKPKLTLWRAVTKDEYDSLENKGQFFNPWNIESKYFSFTREDAEKEGWLLNNLEPTKGPYFLISTSIENQYIRGYNYAIVDGGILTLVIFREQFQFLGKPKFYGLIQVNKML